VQAVAGRGMPPFHNLADGWGVGVTGGADLDVTGERMGWTTEVVLGKVTARVRRCATMNPELEADPGDARSHGRLTHSSAKGRSYSSNCEVSTATY
jgi:hypothetical protein